MRNIRKLTPATLKEIIKEEKMKLQKEQKYENSLKQLTTRQKKLLKEIKTILKLKKLLKKRITKG